MNRVFLSLFFCLVSTTSAQAIDCQTNLSSYADQVGQRSDEFIHLTIEDKLWAQTILPKSALAPKVDPRDFRMLQITRGNADFPEIKYGDDYVTYFDKLEVDRVLGSREQGRILLYLKSGVSFEMIFKPGMRRHFELWVHGLTGSVGSKKILSAASGLEFYM